MFAHDSVPVWPPGVASGAAGAARALRADIFALWSNGLSDEQADRGHVPVLLEEAIAALRVKEGGDRYIDTTFGSGGYTKAILEVKKSTRILALDRDPEAVRNGASLVAQAGGRLTLVEARFGEVADIARESGFDVVDGVVFAIGVSSMQLEPARGFSFRHDGPLDMRMSAQGMTAADIVNSESGEALADILRRFGEERFAARIARAIVASRREAAIRTTKELQRIVAGAVPAARAGIDPATRSFQALRIAVNDELGELVRGLSGAASLLRPGGRLVVVTFHSLEDRIVKRFLQGRTMRASAVSRHLPSTPRAARVFDAIGGPIIATPAEIARNPRARSAKLRYGLRGDSLVPSDLSALLELATLPASRQAQGRRQ
jgi:16S rRNA (cytosine1402-N4)-methyltransferase